jgi:hypothetical protein
MVETNEVLWLHEDSDRGRFATAFPVHLRSSQSVRHRTVFAEVFWGDLSQLRKGIVGLVRGIMDLVFGLRYVAFVAADQPSKAAWLLQWLGLVSSRVLHGPLLAVNFMLALIMLTLAGTELLWPMSSESSRWTSLLVFLIVALTLVAAIPVWRIAANRIQERFWFWVMVTAAYLGVVLVLNHLPTLGGNVNNLDDVASIFQTEEGLGLFELQTPVGPDGKLLAEAPTDARPLPPIQLVSGDNQENKAAEAIAGGDEPILDLPHSNPRIAGVDPSRQLKWYARLLIVTMGLLWLSLMIMLIVMGGAWFAARLCRRANRRGLDVGLLLPLVAIGGWSQFLPIIWLAGQNALSKFGKIQQLDDLFDEAVPLLGIQCVMCVLLGIVQLLVFIYYAAWRPRNDVENYSPSSKPPRLIVNFAVQATTAGCASIGIALILALGWNEYRCIGHDHGPIWEFIRSANRYAIMVLAPMIGLFFVAFRYLGYALDIVLDVVNHFYFRRISEPEEGMKFEGDFEESGLSLDQGRMYFSKRALIHSRMVQILEHFRRVAGNTRPILTVAAHSQGSLIAIEVLNSPRLTWLREAFREIRLVTLGTPFTHIYQHYFSHNYPPLDQPYWSQLRQRVRVWHNIFRVDDFVGTAVDFPDSLRGSSEIECNNFPIKRCGHNNYWSDKQVIEILRTHAAFAWVADDPKPARPDSPPNELTPTQAIRRAA